MDKPDNGYVHREDQAIWHGLFLRMEHISQLNEQMHK